MMSRTLLVLACGVASSMAKEPPRGIVTLTFTNRDESPMYDFPNYYTAYAKGGEVTTELDFDRAAFAAVQYHGVEENFATRHTAYLNVDVSGTYKLLLTSDDGSRLWLDDVLRIENGGSHGPITKSATLELEAGAQHRLEVHYFQRGGGARLLLQWQLPNGTIETISGTNLQPTLWKNIPSA